MRLNKFLLSAAIISSIGLTSVAHAELLRGQAGDIAAGNEYTLVKGGGIASYYKDGTSGDVTFTCELRGDGVKAWLYPGKNFDGNVGAELIAGMNGPYKWTLHDYKDGENTGNIKVALTHGDTAVVRCKQIA